MHLFCLPAFSLNCVCKIRLFANKGSVVLFTGVANLREGASLSSARPFFPPAMFRSHIFKLRRLPYPSPTATYLPLQYLNIAAKMPFSVKGIVVSGQKYLIIQQVRSLETSKQFPASRQASMASKQFPQWEVGVWWGWEKGKARPFSAIGDGKIPCGKKRT